MNHDQLIHEKHYIQGQNKKISLCIKELQKCQNMNDFFQIIISASMSFEEINQIIPNITFNSQLQQEGNILVRILQNQEQKFVSQIQDLLKLQQICQNEYFKELYTQGKLQQLDHELKHLYRFTNIKNIDLDFFDINKIYKNNNTLYEHCILLKKYKHIRKYCQFKLKKACMYHMDKFFQYSKDENIQALYYCIQEGVDPDTVDEIGELDYDENDEEQFADSFRKTIFIHACEYDKIRIVKMLIKNFRINLLWKDIYTHIGFQYACCYNGIDVIEYLLKNYPEQILQVNYHDRSGIFEACENNDLDIVKTLLNYMPSISDKKDKDGNTIFHQSCAKNCLDVVKFLLCCNPKLISFQNNDGKFGIEELSKENEKKVHDFFQYDK